MHGLVLKHEQQQQQQQHNQSSSSLSTTASPTTKSLVSKMTTSLHHVYEYSNHGNRDNISKIHRNRNNGGHDGHHHHHGHHNKNHDDDDDDDDNNGNDREEKATLPPTPLPNTNNNITTTTTTNNNNKDVHRSSTGCSSSSSSSKKRISPTRNIVYSNQISTSDMKNMKKSTSTTKATAPSLSSCSQQQPSSSPSALSSSLPNETIQSHTNSSHENENNKSSSKQHHHHRQQQECFTNPCQPHFNKDLDNIDGNLIIHKDDLIHVMNQNIRYHPKHNNNHASGNSSGTTNTTNTTTTFRVISLLGQGTFAQVFKCINVKSGELCAIKIVKNKPAYTRQAAIEIDIFLALSQQKIRRRNSVPLKSADMFMQEEEGDDDDDYDEDEDDEFNQRQEKTQQPNASMVSLLSYFMHQSHLCLVFELLGLNLYEVLKKRQFRGLSLPVVRSLVKQAVHGTKALCQKNIVHCDLKPENILVVSNDNVDSMVNSRGSKSVSNMKEIKQHQQQQCQIKLIDFGSACFEGQATHTYIQSRFYRSPEILLGIDYDSSIDMWSLGCVAAELFLGLPILPGLHEHDQLGRICEMIGQIPTWMLEQG